MQGGQAALARASGRRSEIWRSRPARRRRRRALPLRGRARRRRRGAPARREAAAAADGPGRRRRPWLLGDGDPAARARLSRSDRPLARYLDARAALARGEGRRALERLERLDPDALPGSGLPAEARRLAGEAACAAGAYAAGASALRALAGVTKGEAEGERIEDAARRCEFEEREYGKPIAE
jgi:hypothetical protein